MSAPLVYRAVELSDGTFTVQWECAKNDWRPTTYVYTTEAAAVSAREVLNTPAPIVVRVLP